MRVRRITVSRMVFTATVVVAAAVAAYAVWLTSTGRALEYQAAVLERYGAFLPDGLVRLLGRREERAALAAVGIHTLVQTAIASAGGSVIFGLVVLADRARRRRRRRTTTVAQRDLLVMRSPHIRMRLSFTSHDWRGGDDGTWRLDAARNRVYRPSSFDEVFGRIARVDVATSRPPRTALERFVLALHEVLAAHRHWPADPDGHHADVGLYRHSLHVAKRMKALIGDDPLAEPIGLAHDIGKLLAYERTDRRLLPRGYPEDAVFGEYRKLPVRHDWLSAQVVRMLPEFYALDADERRILVTVLTYAHAPHRVPTAAPRRALDLIEALREADGLATREEQRERQPEDTALVEAIRERLWDLLAKLNVNKSRDHVARCEGWTKRVSDYVAIEAQALLERLRDVLDAETQRALQLGRDNVAPIDHPATPVVAEALAREGVLLRSYRAIAPRHALFGIKAGKFRKPDPWVWLLKREVVEARLERIVEQWGNFQYTIRVLDPDREAQLKQELEEAAQAGAAAIRGQAS